MSYTAQVYNVMLASPSDVNEERIIAREIIYEQSRNLKRLVNVHLTIGKVKFVNPKDK